MNKTLNLNAYGVQEMNAVETKQINGGLLPIVWFLLGVAVSELLDRDSPSDFQEGRQAYRNL